IDPDHRPVLRQERPPGVAVVKRRLVLDPPRPTLLVDRPGDRAPGAVELEVTAAQVVLDPDPLARLDGPEHAIVPETLLEFLLRGQRISRRTGKAAGDHLRPSGRGIG